MTFVAAKCPQCGGEMQLDNSADTGFCMHCGSKIVIQDAIRAVRIDNTHMIDTWMKMADSARENGNHSEAYEYYKKVVESDPNNRKAILLKGSEAACQSSYRNTRFEEVYGAMEEYQRITSGFTLSLEEVVNDKGQFLIDVFTVACAYRVICNNMLLQATQNEFLEDSDKAVEIKDGLSELIKVYELFQSEITFASDLYKEWKGFKLNCLKMVAVCCREISNVYDYEFSAGMFKITWLSGLPLSEKQKYIDSYDLAISIVRVSEPDFEKDKLIDRLNPTLDLFNAVTMHGITGEERKKENLRVQKEMLEKKYWEEHPEEYQAKLDEEKRKKQEIEEKKKRLSNEINDKSTQLEATKKSNDLEIINLRNERGKLGIFAGSQKKIIDQRIIDLENEYIKIRTEIDELRKQLQEL